MTPDVEIETTVRVKLDIETAARWFANLNDDEQARFLTAVCEEAKAWKGGLGQSHQWWLVGSHLRNCECSSEAAREMVRSMFDGLQNGTH